MTEDARADRRSMMMEQAGNAATTPFDYIVVGSGAGGGPLAVRLALGGKRVLVLEAGCDPAVENADGGDPVTSDAFDEKRWREVYQVPAYHCAVSEDESISWTYSVRHYADYNVQKRDSKYAEDRDPSRGGTGRKGGIQYPRCAAVGGCTAHHAMVIIRPSDGDWDRIAERTGDSSWRASAMQGYFARLEKCMHQSAYQGFLREKLWLLYRAWEAVATLINPRSQLDPAGHGDRGWQPTSFISPKLVELIGSTDRLFGKLLFKVAYAALAGEGKGLRALLKSVLVRFQLLQMLDPNNVNERRRGKMSVAFMPIGTDGKRRTGLREWLLHNAQTWPKRLVIETGAHVTRILFTKDGDGAVPRAYGVEVTEGLHRYDASPLYEPVRADDPNLPRARYFAREEIIVCGGAFNTPQLLMLSGVGKAAHLAKHEVDGLYGVVGNAVEKVGDIVDLPGVGRNLQDRCEVSVISRVAQDFSMLQSLSFIPGDEQDSALKEWRKQKTGLYTINGTALSLFFNSTEPPGKEPDFFIFGFPAAFRGYYWGWSKDLQLDPKSRKTGSRDLWSWIIAKSHSSNTTGLVRLWSNSPYEQPEIVFHSFPEGDDRDVEALCRAVRHVRYLNEKAGDVLKEEIWPPNDKDYANGSAELRAWIRDEAWGHHPCGTCRIGSDAWRADVRNLADKGAVLDSRFRVHGVKGLRVVDASVFPEIPAYFLVAATFMVGEKAADTILADSRDYPQRLEAAEAAAIKERREAARCENAAAGGYCGDPARERLPENTVGLALSGGGIRSATFSLGILQALARRNRLRCVDMLSTVSGGGYTGGFLGRLYTRLSGDVADKPEQVQRTIGNSNSAEIWWIRRHADYLAANGRTDWRINLGIYWRNLVAVYLCVGLLLLALLGGVRWISDAQWFRIGAGTQPAAAVATPAPAPAGADLRTVTSVQSIKDSARTLVAKISDRVPPSPWWWVPLAILALAVIPISLSFWLTPRRGTRESYPVYSLLAWGVLVVAAVAAFRIPLAAPWAVLALAMLILAWVWQEGARAFLPEGTRNEQRSVIVRNRLSRYVGKALLLFAAAVAWVLLDSAAWGISRSEYMLTFAGTMGGIVLLLPLLKQLLERYLAGDSGGRRPLLTALLKKALKTAIAVLLGLALLLAVDVVAHGSFERGALPGSFVVLFALAFSLTAARAFDVLNRSSLQSAYAERLARTFLGATNPARTHPTRYDASPDVQFADPGDDLLFHEYHPERAGGPLHLIGLCINETSDAASGRSLPEDKGLPMCVGPCGVSVGRRFHALWEAGAEAKEGLLARIWSALEESDEDDEAPEVDGKTALRAIPAAADPGEFHVFGRKQPLAAPAEVLALSQWLGISGAAFSTGMGRKSSFSSALLYGLFNVRLGYWWDSGVNASERPGRYPPGLLRRIRSLPGALFNMQFKILDEWRARFDGPHARHWHLTDGGHYENTGIYELVRRRLPLIVAVDATADPRYEFEDLALLARQVRMDFGAEISWLDPTKPREKNRMGWDAVRDAAGKSVVPDWIQGWFNPDEIGPLGGISRTGPHAAALAAVTWKDDPDRTSWLLLVKAGAAGRVPVDIANYVATSATFPNETTADQFFDEAQWESYRKLGELLGERIFLELASG